MIQLVPSLASGFFQDTTRILGIYLFLEEQPLLNRLTKYEVIEAHSDEQDLSDSIADLAFAHLRTVYQVVSTTESGLPESSLLIELQKILLVCHGARNAEIAKLASKSMGMIVKIVGKLDPSLFGLWWDCIETCLSNPDLGVDPENVYVLWLRCISSNILAQSLPELQRLFNSEDYWSYLRNGILSKTYEIRKYVLYILSQSLLKVQENINLPSMTWDVSKKDEYIWEWQRYTTLVNIISIDTSLHQAEDSTADLIKIIGKRSLIPKNWARCLLSTGLQSSMETLRKFIGDLAMGVPSEDMEIFASDFSFMTNVLLPYLMSAHHFSVVKSKGTPSIDICPFGERLADFISSLFSYLDDDSSRQACNYFLSLLYKQRHSFDPARLYVMYGIERGLCNRNVLSVEELELLKSLFSSSTETKLREKAIFYLYFRLLLSTSDKLVSFREWFTILVDITTTSSYLYLDNADHVVDFIKSSSYLRAFNTLEDSIRREGLYELLPVYLDLNIRMGNKIDETILSGAQFDQLLELSFSEIPSMIDFLQGREPQQTISREMVTLVKDIVEPEKADSALVLKVSQSYTELQLEHENIFKFSEYIHDHNSYVTSLWNQIYSIKAIDETNLEYVYSQLSMLSIVLEQSHIASPSPIESEQILGFLNRLIRTKTPTKALNVIKNNALSDAYHVLRSLHISTNVEELFEGFINQLDLITSQCRRQICFIISELINDDPGTVGKFHETVSRLLKTFWDALVTDRLIATERDLHISFIELAFSEHLIIAAVDNSFLAHTLEEIAEEVIQQSYARRSILPTLSQKLYYYHTSHPNKLYQWLGRIVISVFTFVQISDNLFRLENVIADHNDHLIQERNNLNHLSSSYTKEYGRNEHSSKIDMIYILASLKLDQPAAVEYAKYIHEFILESPRYHIFEPIKRNDGLEEAERTRLYQVLTIISRFIEPNLDAIETLTNDVLVPALYTEPSPVVRTYIEWLISRFSVVLLEKGKPSALLSKLDNADESPRVLASYQRMCLMVARRLKSMESANWIQYYYDYILKVIPFGTSNRAATRHFSVSMLCAVSSEFEKTSQPNKLNDLVYIAHGITTQAKSSDTFKQYRSGESSIWDIEEDYTVLGICGGVLNKVSDRVFGEIEEQNFALYRPISEVQVPIGLSREFIKWTPEAQTTSESSRELNKQESMPLQVKSTSWNSVIDTTVGEGGRDSDRVQRGDLIVLSSLVDKPPNLGGICRLCDVLGAKELCVNDISITRNPQFKNVAVSADLWMPMSEVKEQDIIKFMMEKKREGYTLIGLEQTDKSVQLNADLKFPRKSLILLGKEREGIPAEYLAELDFCVEIKQVGVIRSMNIQTATAVIVHAYSIQHC